MPWPTLSGHSFAVLKSLSRKKFSAVRMVAMAASLPISSHVGATAVAMTSAPNNSSRATATVLPNFMRMSRCVNAEDLEKAS